MVLVCLPVVCNTAQTPFAVGLSGLPSTVPSCRAEAGMETVVSSWGASVGPASFHRAFEAVFLSCQVTPRPG